MSAVIPPNNRGIPYNTYSLDVVFWFNRKTISIFILYKENFKGIKDFLFQKLTNQRTRKKDYSINSIRLCQSGFVPTNVIILLRFTFYDWLHGFVMMMTIILVFYKLGSKTKNNLTASNYSPLKDQWTTFPFQFHHLKALSTVQLETFRHIFAWLVLFVYILLKIFLFNKFSAPKIIKFSWG